MIVIPIGTGSKDNWELKYHLRSLEANCKFYFTVMLLCEPEVDIPWITGVERINYPRFYPEALEEVYGNKLFENFFCVLNKYRAFSQSMLCPEEFVVAYDDQLLLRPIQSFKDFDNLALCKENMSKIRGRMTRHEATIKEALDIAHRHKHRNGLFNYATHAYRVFDKQKINKLFRDYPLEQQKIPYELATTYYNIHADAPYHVLQEGSQLVGYLHWSDGINHVVPLNQADLDSMPYTMISYNDMGMKDSFFRPWVEQRLPNKSRFEI